MRDVNQIINEGKAIIAAKDNEITKFKDDIKAKDLIIKHYGDIITDQRYPPERTKFETLIVNSARLAKAVQSLQINTNDLIPTLEKPLQPVLEKKEFGSGGFALQKQMDENPSIYEWERRNIQRQLADEIKKDMEAAAEKVKEDIKNFNESGKFAWAPQVKERTGKDDTGNFTCQDYARSSKYKFVEKSVLEAQEKEIQSLKDQNTDYLNKITADHKELTSLRTEIKHDNAIIDRIGEDLKHATEQYHVLRRLVIALLVIYGATVAVLLSLIYSLS